MPPSPGEDTVRERLRRLPAVLRQTLDTALPALPPDAAARGITTTGVGSSEAAARLLTHLLQSAGIRSSFLPFASFYSGDLPLPASPPYLAVFSQGLAPNACMVLHRRAAFAGTLLFTAATPAGQKQAGRTERAALLETLLREGACILTHPEENEYLILPRFLGPVCALLTACRVAEALAPGCCGGPAALAQIPDRFHPIPCAAADAAEAAAELRHHPVFLFSNSVGLYAQNLAAKCMETLLTPPPLVADCFTYAHGLFQVHCALPAAKWLFCSADADEADLFARLEPLLRRSGPLRVLRSTLPPPLAVFDFEARLNAILLAILEQEMIDLVKWPGQGQDGEGYGIHLPGPGVWGGA